ncbi:MAG: hypothetical protein KBT28_01705 [Bacteroidales bacterium]|nr:hypothetical protein [Candidatus Colimorpha merdihippi]
MEDVNMENAVNNTLDELLDGITHEQAGIMAAKLAVSLVGEHTEGLAEIAHCLYNPQPDADMDYMDMAGLDLVKIVNCLIKWTMDTICHFDKEAEAKLREEYDAVMNKWHEEQGEVSPFIAYKE